MCGTQEQSVSSIFLLMVQIAQPVLVTGGSNARQVLLGIAFSSPKAFPGGFSGTRFCISYTSGDFLLC